MATYSDTRTAGGKITAKTRRRFNPYERPAPPPPPPESPNWFNGVIVPVSRKIASGAAKIISSVFVSDSSSSSSSGNESDEDVHSDNDHDISSHGVDGLQAETGTSSKALDLGTEKSESKLLIEQLVLEETFSREEFERLVNIIKSRVVGNSAVEERKNIIGSDSLDLREKAVTEARKWVKERRVGSSPASDIRSSGGYFDRLQHTGSKDTSPVDVAKSYMNARPPWASPSSEHANMRTPSMMIGQLTRDGNGGSYSSSKRSSLASGSWNIQDEIRRVRAKATENMLQTLSSPKVDLSSFALSPRTGQEYIDADTFVARTSYETVFNSPLVSKEGDRLGESAAGGTTKLDSSGFENKQDDLVNEASLSKDGTCVPVEKQDLEAVQNNDTYAAATSNHLDIPDHTADCHADKNLVSQNGSTEKEAKEYAETQDANGLPASQASLSSGGISGEMHRHPAEQEESLASLDQLNSSRGTPVEDKRELLSEASVEVPVSYESNTQNSREELSQEQDQQEGTVKLAGKPQPAGAKQGKKTSRYTRRGKGRAK